MSDRNKILKAVAEWAHTEKHENVPDGIVVLNKYDLDKESLRSFEGLYASVSLSRFVLLAYTHSIASSRRSNSSGF